MFYKSVNLFCKHYNLIILSFRKQIYYYKNYVRYIIFYCAQDYIFLIDLLYLIIVRF